MAIICHCEAVTDAKVVAAIEQCGPSMCDLARFCGAGSRCGGCHPALDDLIDRHAGPTGITAAATA